MKRVEGLFSRLVRDESGQDMIEYALVAALVALGAVASMQSFASLFATLVTLGSQVITATV